MGCWDGAHWSGGGSAATAVLPEVFEDLSTPRGASATAKATSTLIKIGPDVGAFTLLHPAVTANCEAAVVGIRNNTAALRYGNITVVVTPLQLDIIMTGVDVGVLQIYVRIWQF